MINWFLLIFLCIFKKRSYSWIGSSSPKGPLSWIYSKYDNCNTWWFMPLTLKLSWSVIHFNFSWWTFLATSGIPKQHLHSLAVSMMNNCYSCTCVRSINKKIQLGNINDMNKIFTCIKYYLRYLPRVVFNNIFFIVTNTFIIKIWLAYLYGVTENIL